MASYYVYSGAGGAGTGADWTNAFTTMTLALSGKAAGDIFYVAHDHAESTAGTVTLAFPGTAASPNVVICADRAGSVPPVAADLRATAAVTTTGNSAITMTGFFDIDGTIFTFGSGAVGANLNLITDTNAGAATFRNCSLVKGGTSSSGTAFSFASQTQQNTRKLVTLINTTLTFGNTGDRIRVGKGTFVWRDTPSALGGATFPVNLFGSSVNYPHIVRLENVDLSAMGSNTIVPSLSDSVETWLVRCKLGSSAVIGTTSSGPGEHVYAINCDSGGTNYRHEKWSYAGNEATETTIVRTGGASDGTTPASRKIVTSANAKWIAPYESLPLVVWNETTGSSVTVTVYGIWGGGAVPNNDDIWIDVEYLGSSGSPIGSVATTGKASYLVTGSATTADSSTWGGSTTKFKMAATFTPQMKGPINIRVKAGAASSTFYIDPKIEVS